MGTAKTTYRVQGLPADASTYAIKIIISHALGEETSTLDPTIHSLASDPYRPPDSGSSTNVATVTFKHAPKALKDGDRLTANVPWESKTHYITVDSSFGGFTPLNDAKAQSWATIDVIAVSGLSSHPFGSWKARGGTFMWLRDEVAKTTKNARVLLYGYDTSLVSSESFQDVSDIAQRLSSDLYTMRNGRYNELPPNPIVFVAHSLGGLVVKEAIYKMSEQYSDDFLSIYGLLLFGVPNGGIETKYWMPIVDSKPNKSLIDSLAPDAYYLRNLQENFNKVFCFPEAKVTSVFETKKSATAKEESPGKWKLTGPPDILVTRSSATGHYSERIQHTHIAFNQNHSDLPKFDNNYDENYRAIEPFFNECYHYALEVIHKRFIGEALKPIYTVNSNFRSRGTCLGCSKVYDSRIKLLRHLKEEGNDPCYFRVLRSAIRHGLGRTVSILLIEDERINAKDESTGSTLLHYAARTKWPEMSRFFLDRGADIEARDENGSTPFNYVVEPDVAKLFLDRGVQIETKHRDEATTLIRSAYYGITKVVKFLLDRGANIEAKDCYGLTPLGSAAYRGHADTIKLLLDRGANIESKTKNGETPLGLATWSGEAAAMRLLLERGADIDARNKYTLTPLHVAAQTGRADIAEILLDAGAYIKSRDGRGRMPLLCAVQEKKTDVAKLLRSRGAKDTPFTKFW